MRWRERDGVRWLEAELPGSRAAFTARVGGVSEPPFDSLNVAVLTGDQPDAVLANRHRLASALGLKPERVLIGRQVHGAEIARHERPQRPSAFAQPGPELAEADGQVAERDGLAPLVMVADCLPIAVEGRGGVAMLHGGWRGLATGIVERGAEAAAIGPGIGACCYEVGDEVLEAFARLGNGVASDRMLDLRAVARRLLEGAGVEVVAESDLCTSCNPDLLFSHRRDGGRTGRQAGLVWSGNG